MDMRETGDYGGIVGVSQTDAQMCIEKARSIIEAVKQLCPELNKG
jgi:hypothetical protein